MPATARTIRHLATLQDFDQPLLECLLDRAAEFRKRPIQPVLAHKKLAMVFFNPSLRTRVSFQAAMADLGGSSFVLETGAGLWKLEFADGAVMDRDTVEHAKDAVKVLARYVDAIGVRAFADGKDWAKDREDAVLASFVRHSTVPVINMESALDHPCQALADLRTLLDRLGNLRGKRIALVWAWHPKALPLAVPHAFALAASRFGTDLSIVCPEGYGLDPEIHAAVVANAARSRGTVRVVHDRERGLAGAQAVYVKSWSSLERYGRTDGPAHPDELRPWILDAQAHARTDGAIVMHCLPVRRNVVISDAVLDGPSSVVYDEAENRLHVQKAVLEWALS